MKPVDGGFTEYTGIGWTLVLAGIGLLVWLLGSWIVQELRESREEREWVRKSPLTASTQRAKQLRGHVQRHAVPVSAQVKILANLASRAGTPRARKGGSAVNPYPARHSLRSVALRCQDAQ